MAAFVLAVAGRAAPLLLVSIDALRPDYITQADAHGVKAEGAAGIDRFSALRQIISSRFML